MKGYGLKIDSFSGPAADLKGHDRTPEKVLEALRKNPLISCFDMSEHLWLCNAINALKRQGLIEVDLTVGYPWTRYIPTTAQPQGEG